MQKNTKFEKNHSYFFGAIDEEKTIKATHK